MLIEEIKELSYYNDSGECRIDIEQLIDKIDEQTKIINSLSKQHNKKAKKIMVKELMKRMGCNKDRAKQALLDNDYDIERARDAIYNLEYL